MGQNQFAESLVETMLSWMRWLTGWFWNIINSGGTNGSFLVWFSDNWKSLTVFLIVAGIIVDWLIWMIRWRPYWLWLRKRQIIYEEVPVHKKKARPAEEDEFTEYEYSHDDFDEADDEEYLDEFGEDFDASAEYPSDLPTEGEEFFVNNTAADTPAAQADDLSEWDSFDDPYSAAAQQDTQDYRAPETQSKKVTLNHSRPVLGERMNLSDVDDGQ